MCPLIQGSPGPGIQPPASAFQVIEDDIFSLTLEGQEGSPQFALFKDAVSGNVGVSKAYELYEADLAGASQDVLRRAQFKGWYYVLFAEAKPIGYLEMVLQRNGLYEPRRIGGGRWMQDLLDECRFAETLDVVQQDDCILSYLRVWSLGIFALWIRPRTAGGRDIVIPLPPTNSVLRPQANTAHNEDRFVELVRSMARLRLDTGLNVIGAP